MIRSSLSVARRRIVRARYQSVPDSNILRLVAALASPGTNAPKAA